MRKDYQHLCRKERSVIYHMMQEGKTQIEIAKALGRSQGTISKELKRNSDTNGYKIREAQRKAAKRKRSKARRSYVIKGALKSEIEERLRKKQGPQQISGGLARRGVKVSHETIYRYIAKDKLCGGDLYKHLMINSKRTYMRRSKDKGRGGIKDRVGIEERPKIVEERKRYGDWEADLIEGSKGSGYLLSLYERKSRLGKLVRLESKESVETADGIIEALRGYLVKTITYDNGLEFARHKEVSMILEARSYFCNPYHSWEKGGVENFNRLVRKYYPKGSSFEHISEEELQRIEDEINDCPRKILNYKTPTELEPKIVA